jgi:hypothetical protein
MGPTRSEASAPATGSILFLLPWTVNNWEFQKGFGGSFLRVTIFQRNFTAFSDFELRAVARVDVNIFRCEIAGPHACCPAARIQIDADRNKRCQHLTMRDALVESVFAAVAANRKTSQMDVHAIGFKFDAGAARGRDNPAPIRIRAGEGRLDQWRIRDGARDLNGRGIGRRSAHFDFDHPLGAFAIGHNLQGERFTDFLERPAEILVRCIFSRNFARAGLSIRQQRHRIIRGRVAIHSDGVECAIHD